MEPIHKGSVGIGTRWETYVRVGLIGSSLLATSLLLTGCQNPSQNRHDKAATLQNAEWSDQAIAQLRDAIGKRAIHGLDGMRFDIGASRDNAQLTRVALAYAGALARGATDPDKLFDVYTVPRPHPDLQIGLAEALKAGKVGEWLNSLAPQDDGYRKLSDAYVALRAHGNAQSAAIPDVGAAIRPGTRDRRIPAIAHQLAVFDYLKEPGQGDLYDAAKVAAIKAMQADYGIRPDGVIGSDVLAILNLSDMDRARAIAVNMERLRWLDRDVPATRIDVNLAAARLTYWRDGKIADTRRVVVGEPDKETPQLGSPIFRLVANPTWTVPKSIQNKEIAGKGAGYLRRNNMIWKDGRIVQRSGPKNSLGLVKFDMKNNQAIYLHDTPAKQLFSATRRQHSHGCVRVEDALGFADMLAKDEGVTDQWQRARATDKETFVPLPREIPVRMLYQAVLLDDSGVPIVRSDPYGWNDRVAKALGLGTGGGHHLKATSADIGP